MSVAEKIKAPALEREMSRALCNAARAGAFDSVCNLLPSHTLEMWEAAIVSAARKLLPEQDCLKVEVIGVQGQLIFYVWRFVDDTD